MPYWIAAADNNRDNLFFQKKLRVLLFTLRSCPAGRSTAGGETGFSHSLGSSSSRRVKVVCVHWSQVQGTILVCLVLPEMRWSDNTATDAMAITMGPLITLAPSWILTCWLFPSLLLTFLSFLCWHVSCCHRLKREIGWRSAWWWLWKSDEGLWPTSWLAPSRGGDSWVFVVSQCSLLRLRIKPSISFNPRGQKLNYSHPASLQRSLLGPKSSAFMR